MSEDVLEHIGTKRHSGRYPWGSSNNVPGPEEARTWQEAVFALRNEGWSDSEIAKSFDIDRTTLQARLTAIKGEEREAQRNQVVKLKEKGMSTNAIAKLTEIPESTVRTLLAPRANAKYEELKNIASMLKERVDSTGGYIDIGKGVSNWMDISDDKLKQAVALLKDEGYAIHTVQTPQATGGPNQKTYVKVVAPPGTAYVDIVKNMDRINAIGLYAGIDGTVKKAGPPTSIDSKRIAVRWAEDGGAEADGVVYVRRGVDDVSLGGARYAQVRIAVDGTHYIKGMAVYSDDMPKGVDLYVNSNKSKADAGGDIHKALKPMKEDADLPFGSLVRPREYRDAKGEVKQSVMNMVGGTEGAGEEGYWSTWSKTLSSQMLSKQKPVLIKQQLDLTYDKKKKEFDEIMSLTNPLVKQKLLEEFAGSADSASVHLKAAGLPRTANHVILPIPGMKETEVYAPGYNNGERVVLIRHPHGGIFEIPELTVNNKIPLARKMIGSDAPDAIGINHKVAEQLSGADFDGDTVLVIPNKPSGPSRVNIEPPLKSLKGFDPKQYKFEDGKQFANADPDTAAGRKKRNQAKQKLMGEASNLITDMTIKGALFDEIAKAVKYSMVAIDADKHNLNVRQAEIDYSIPLLKAKYQKEPGQKGGRGGASTIISRASSDARVPEQKLRRASEGGPIDKDTGELVYTPTGRSYINKQGKVVESTTKLTKMAATKDAYTLVSRDHNGQTTGVEKVYADHANKMKALANQARKETLSIKPTPLSSTAKVTYSNEVAALNAKLNVALKNAPLERRAQVLANTQVALRKEANPDMDADELKKVRQFAIKEARAKTGAGKTQIHITDKEWEAIQAGAVSGSRLSEILKNADTDRVKQLATPRANTVVTAAVEARMKAMAARGATPAEIGAALGISASTISSALGRS